MCWVTSVVSDSATLWTVALQALLSVGFSRQEYWSGLPCPPPGDLPDPGIEPPSPTSLALAGGFVTTNGTWEALYSLIRPQTGLPQVVMMLILSISLTWIRGSVACLSVRTGTPLLWALIVVQSLSLVWLFVTHGVRQARLPCPSPSPGVCSDSLNTNYCCQFLRSLGLR